MSGRRSREDLAQRRDLVLGAIDRPVFTLRIVEAVLPRAVLVGHELQGQVRVPHPPDAMADEPGDLGRALDGDPQ